MSKTFIDGFPLAFDAFIDGFFLIAQPEPFLYMLFGIALGILLGAIPGLGGVIGLVVLLPFTFGMDTVPAIAMLLGLFAVTSTSDTIASVMLGIPGTAASQATILDGYPLAQKGEARRAFGAAYTVSAFGGVFGAFIMALSMPFILPIILKFGRPELFALGILGLIMVGSLSGGSILKGLLAALLGLMISTIGDAGPTSIPRYWFDSMYLLNGLPLIPVVLGLFAIPELLELAVRDTSISQVKKEMTKDVTIWTGVRDAFTHWWLATRCAALGTYIGMLPGLGASIVDWLAYGHAMQSAKDQSKFGQGDIRGVIAPEAANNAVRGGALIPTVAFGIPGSLPTALLLGALVIQGLTPGPKMLTEELPLTFSMVWTVAIANIIAAVVLMFLTNQVAKVAFIRGHLIVPAVIMFVFMGAWLGGTSIGDWITCLTMGVIGFVMKRGGWPRPPLVLALILGLILENSFLISMRLHGFDWLLRPIVMGIGVLIVITFVLAVRGIARIKRAESAPKLGEGSERNPIISLPLSLALLVMFIGAAIESLDWIPMLQQFPLTVAVPGAILALVVLLRDTIHTRKSIETTGGITAAFREAWEKAVLGRSLKFLGYLLAMVLMTLVVGQIVAIAIFLATYLWRWGGYKWKLIGGYTASGMIFLWVFYDQAMHIFWHPSLLRGFYKGMHEFLHTPSAIFG